MRTIVVCLCSTFLFVGCQFGVTGKPGGHEDMSTMPDGNVPPPDLAMPDLSTCNNGDKICKESAVFTCNNSNQFVKTYDCPFDCASTPTAHCKQMVPTAPVTADDIKPGLPATPATWATATTISFDTETGEIRIVGGGTLRHKNTTAAYQEMDSIGFRVDTSGHGYAIWSFGDITISSTTTILFKGKNNPLPSIGNAVALVSSGNINVLGIIDARGYDFAFNPPSLCSVADMNGNVVAGPGGGLGGTGTTCTAGAGDSGGGGACVMQFGNDSAGGGGGGFGEHGGLGGGAVNTTGGKGGTVNGDPMLSPLVGGSGGGRGNVAGVGGGGGGAIQLVALGKITIGGGINAGGCSGKNTHPNGGNNSDGAGGGGSGGSILFEAKAVEILATGILAANGGSGAGAGKNGTNGSPGALSDVAASGGTATGNDTAGGTGSGPNGQALAGSIANTAQNGAAGGGGGGAGRIGVRSLSFVNNGVISPNLNAMNSKGEKVAFTATLPTQ